MKKFRCFKSHVIGILSNIGQDAISARNNRLIQTEEFETRPGLVRHISINPSEFEEITGKS